MTQAQPDLFHDKVSKAMIAVTLWKHKGEEKVKNDLEANLRKINLDKKYFAIIDRVSRYICHKPMPEFG